jgi:hypothetical protein
MSKDAEKKLIKEILGDDFTKRMLQELGVQDSTLAVREELLGKLSENIHHRVMLELLAAVPGSARDEFQKYIGTGNPEGFRAFLEEYVPNLDTFIVEEANKEYERTKTNIRKMEQGVL